jgi:succinyl-CoA synthetase beta subunit
MASSEGGMDIEHVAEHTPEKIVKVHIDPKIGLTTAEAEDVARKIGVPDQAVAQGAAFMQSLYKAFDECDCSLAEINPLIYTGDNKVLALDAKLNFDSNALYRHPDIVAILTKKTLRKSRPQNLILLTFRSMAISAASLMVPVWQWRPWT